MPDEPRDTGELAEVPDGDRLDTDGGPGSDASEGGPDLDGLQDAYDDPGEVVPGEDLA